MAPDSNYGPGLFHRGFLEVANQLWDNGMREALDAAVAGGDVRHVIITGHSLGGASTTLLSARAQVSSGFRVIRAAIAHDCEEQQCSMIVGAAMQVCWRLRTCRRLCEVGPDSGGSAMVGT